MSHLKLVENAVVNNTELRLIIRGKQATQAIAERQDVPCALVSLLLAPFGAFDGLIDAGEVYGTQPAVKLDVIYRGERKTIRGAAVPLLSGPDIVLPSEFSFG